MSIFLHMKDIILTVDVNYTGDTQNVYITKVTIKNRA